MLIIMMFKHNYFFKVEKCDRLKYYRGNLTKVE